MSERSTKQKAYHSYVLRFWQDGDQWRIMLRKSNASDPHYFPTIESLSQFLRQTISVEEK